MNLGEGFTLKGSHLYLFGHPIPRRLGFILNLLKHKRGSEILVGSWTFSIPYGILYLRESPMWGRDYTPPGGLQGRTVLDVGAGDGESAKFFIEGGASRVFAVELNPDCIRRLRDNATRNSRLTVYAGAFDPDLHLRIPVDLIKMDIEGYEGLFADYLEAHPEFNVDVVMEVHNDYLVNRFRSLGFSEYPPDLESPIGRGIAKMYRWAV